MFKKYFLAVAFLLCLVSNIAEARLGETKEQIEKRYNVVFEEGREENGMLLLKAPEMTPGRGFNENYLWAVFYKNVCINIIYFKLGKLGMDDPVVAEKITQNNSEGFTWEKKLPYKWLRSDGAECCVYSGLGRRIELTSAKYLELKLAEELEKKEEEKKKLQEKERYEQEKRAKELDNL